MSIVPRKVLLSVHNFMFLNELSPVIFFSLLAKAKFIGDTLDFDRKLYVSDGSLFGYLFLSGKNEAIDLFSYSEFTAVAQQCWYFQNALVSFRLCCWTDVVDFVHHKRTSTLKNKRVRSARTTNRWYFDIDHSPVLRTETWKLGQIMRILFKGTMLRGTRKVDEVEVVTTMKIPLAFL